MIVAATHVSWVRRIDDRARIAAIPREADRLALELAQTADFQPRSERLRSKVSKVISGEIAAQALSFQADGSPAAASLVYILLTCTLEEPGRGQVWELPGGRLYRLK
jgi:hypothetical protein